MKRWYQVLFEQNIISNGNACHYGHFLVPWVGEMPTNISLAKILNVSVCVCVCLCMGVCWCCVLRLCSCHCLNGSTLPFVNELRK